MDKTLILLICAFTTLLIYSTLNIEKHPDDTYIIRNSDIFEGKQVFLRAEMLDIKKSYNEYIIEVKTSGKTYTLFVEYGLLDRSLSSGDLIDFRAVSHLNEGYMTALEAHVRTSSEHRLLFARSLLAIPVVLMVLWRERSQLFGGS